MERGLWPSESSNQSSPMGAASTASSGFGSRIVGIGMLKKRSKKPISRMKRSYTVDFAAAQAEDSPKQQSKSSKERLLTPTDEEEDDLESYGELEDIGVPVRRSSNHLVTAIIESSPREQREAGAASVATSEEVASSRMSSGSLIKPNISEQDDIITISEDCYEPRSEVVKHDHATPPNSAPLPAKFGNSSLGLVHHPGAMQGNLLRVQLQKKSLMDCDTSSAASTTNEVPFSPTIQACQSGSKTTVSELQAQKHQRHQPSSVMKMKLALPLKQRLSLVDSSQDDSSSTDSTPQRRKIRSESKDQVILNKQTKPNISRPKPNAPLLGRKMHSKSKFPLNLSAESESCSSAMSSMESVRSSNSGGSVQSLVSSSESGAGCSMSTSSNSNLSLPASSRPILELRTHRSNILSSNKFTVLSPISDKSQEQSSEHGDSSSKTPKVSPTDHILASCCGMNPDDTENNNQEPAPFAMPKLQRKLMQKQYYHHHSSSAKNSIQGSDSGISMSSQDVQDMVELLKLPFDMPKLRRKTQHILRPASMPINDIAMLRGQDKYLSASMNNEAWPCPKPSDVSTGSTMDNYRFQVCDNNVNRNNDSTFLNESGSAAAETEIPHPAAPPPPPPPGFADENNQFYLTEDEMESTTAQPVGIRQAPSNVSNLSMRRRRPQMTLSFGVDTTQKTLMFATDSPFLLNDCQDIDPSLPLDRQEWYHGGITKEEAVESLRKKEEGAYLVRNVDLHRQEFSLVLKSAKGLMHMKIRRDPSSREFQLSDFPKKFLTIPEMVHHYTLNRLPIKGAEHMCLKKPIAIELLL